MARDPIGETNARLVQLYLHYVTVGDRPEEVAEQVRRATVVLEAAGDHKGLTRAWRTLLNIHFAGCRYLDAEGAAHQMIEHARLADDHAMEMRVPTALATCAQLGPTPVPQAIKVVKKILAGLQGDRKSEAYTQRALGNLEAMRGRFEEARSLCRTSRATLEELGWRHDAALTGAIASGPVELLAGDPAAAEVELRRDYDALDAMGERNYISTTAALLAEALYRQDHLDEADRYSRISEELAAVDDVTTQVLWRCVRGKVLARRGQFEEAERLADEAIEIISEAQDPDTQGNARLDLSEIRHLAGQREAAITAAQEALALFAQKANTISQQRARAVLAELTAGPA